MDRYIRGFAETIEEFRDRIGRDMTGHDLEWFTVYPHTSYAFVYDIVPGGPFAVAIFSGECDHIKTEVYAL